MANHTYKAATYDPETDLAWVIYEIQKVLGNNDNLFASSREYSRREALSLGMSAGCWRAIKEI